MQHLKTQTWGFPLFDEHGEQIGHLDSVQLMGGVLKVEGWTTAARVALVSKDRRVETWPGMQRPDVPGELATNKSQTRKNVGFALKQAFWGTPPALSLESDKARHVFAIPPPGTVNIRTKKLGLILPFALAMTRAMPAILRWRLRGDLAARSAIKMALGLNDGPENVGDLPVRLFQGPETAPSEPIAPDVSITLILPVYNAFDLLAEVLDRVQNHTDLPWRLIVVEDCSSDGRVRPALRDWASAREAEIPGRVMLIEHDQNQGFVQSVNEALSKALEFGDHIVLLNSDAFVPQGWASRLLYPILTQPQVASVTPMSNDAEIFSVPVICQKSQLPEGVADAVDAVAQKLDPEICQAVSPTGVGFCMAINIDFLKQEPQLDTIFGTGYGEEVDWCQRVRAHGGRHLALGTLFVEHHGGASFGDAQKQELVAQNGAIISDRYPRYDAEVQDFIRRDALIGPRLALAIALAGARQKGPIPIYLAHSLGGGAEKYLEQRIAQDITAGGNAVVLRVGGLQRWQLELHDATGQVRGLTSDFSLIQALLEPLKERHIIYSCGVGDPDPVTLPDHLLALKRSETDTIEILLHDFYPLSPSYTLLNSKGVFAGVPEAEDADPAHQARRPSGGRVSLATWRTAWGALVEAADELVVFSEDSKTHVITAYPQAEASVVLRPHDMLADVSEVLNKPGDDADAPPVIGILGNIGYQKGAQVLVDLGRRLGQDDRAKLILVGNIDPNYVLPGNVTVHGNYRIDEIGELVAHYRITHWLIPSIWPETFSFATREALATGIPVMCFDLGAQAEAVRADPNGQVIALPVGADPAQILFDQIAKQIPPALPVTQPVQNPQGGATKSSPPKKASAHEQVSGFYLCVAFPWR